MDYTGNGVTQIFPYTFKIFDISHMVVTQNVGGVESDLIYGTNYTISGVGNSLGGNVSMMAVPAVGTLLVFRRVLPLTQMTDLKNQGAFFPEVHEDEFDNLLMIMQQHQEQINRCIQQGVTDPATVNPDFAASIHAAPLKAAPANADQFGFWDSVTGLLRKFQWSDFLSALPATIQFIAAGIGAVIRTVQAKLRERTSVEDYGALGNGVDDDILSINAAIAAKALAGGGDVNLQGGKTYIVGTAIILKAGVYLRGEGSHNTVIKLKNGANCNILETENFAALTMQNKWLVSEGVPTGFGFDGIRFDGNRLNQTVAGGVAIYGKKYHIGYDVQIVSMKGVGFYSECAFKGGEAVPDDQPEGYIGKIQVWESGQENIIYRGPHDQPIGDLYSALSGQDGVYDGVVFDGKVNVYQGITYVNGTVHSYASSGHGIVCKTQMMFNKLSGEHNTKSGVVLETTSANWVGAYYTNINYLEGYGNDVGGSGLYWNFENRVLGTKVGLCRHSISFASAGSIYNTGHGLRIAAGVVNAAGLANGTGFKNVADFADVNLVMYNFDKVGDVAFESGTSSHCNYKIGMYGCAATAWLNSGTSIYNHFYIDVAQATGTGFSNTGTLANTDTFDVKIVVGGVALLSEYTDILRAITSTNTSVTVTHNAFRTPTQAEIHITLGDSVEWYTRNWRVTNITATTFDLVTDVAAPAAGLPFYWQLSI
jgi:hypothetical protein